MIKWEMFTLNNQVKLVAISLIVASMLCHDQTPIIVRLQSNLNSKDKDLKDLYNQVIDDALQAKKQALISQETARIKAQELEDAKKKICK